MAQRDLKIGYQGVPGSFSAMACTSVVPDAAHVPYHTVETMFAALADGRIDGAMTALENRIAGVVPAVRDLLPAYRFYATREHCQVIRFYAWANPGTVLERVKTARSHPVALAQCGKFLQQQQIAPIPHEDTAGAVQELAATPDPTVVALASQQAGKLYGMACLAENVADNKRNHTRFIMLQRAPAQPPRGRSIGMALATPRDPAQFSDALQQAVTATQVVVTRCDAGADGIWSIDFDSIAGAAATEAVCKALAPHTLNWHFMGHFAPCKLRPAMRANATWFRYAA